MSARNKARVVVVILMAAAILVATGDGFAQSYAGLYGWAVEHGLHGWKAQSFPLMVDLFIGVGELGLFLLAIDGHKLSKSFLSWLDLITPAAVAASGWCASLVFNVGHVAHNFATQATAAVPPLASMIGLLVLLRTLHRYVGQLDDAPAPATAPAIEVAAPVAIEPHLTRARELFAETLDSGEVPSVRRLKTALRIGQPKARQVHAALSE